MFAIQQKKVENKRLQPIRHANARQIDDFLVDDQNQKILCNVSCRAANRCGRGTLIDRVDGGKSFYFVADTRRDCRQLAKKKSLFFLLFCFAPIFISHMLVVFFVVCKMRILRHSENIKYIRIIANVFCSQIVVICNESLQSTSKFIISVF